MIIKEPDSITREIHIKVPESKIVLLKGLFETYDSLGTIRTFDIKTNHVVVITTKDLLEECIAVLESIKNQIIVNPISPDI